jgi:hypothetical protein
MPLGVNTLQTEVSVIKYLLKKSVRSSQKTNSVWARKTSTEKVIDVNCENLRT